MQNPNGTCKFTGRPRVSMKPELRHVQDMRASRDPQWEGGEQWIIPFMLKMDKRR